MHDRSEQRERAAWNRDSLHPIKIAVEDRLHEDREEGQARHDEGAVTHPFHRGHAASQSRPEDHEIERRRDHRSDQALPQSAAPTSHFEAIDGGDAVGVHAGSFLPWTNSTKMSSRLDW